MTHFVLGLVVGIPLLLGPLTTRAQPVPDVLTVESDGKKLCEKLQEDAQILLVRCTFPPGSTQGKHSHPGYISYTLSGGKAEIEDAKGKRQVDLRAGNTSISPPVPWHTLTNIGDTPISFLVIERKYEPVAPAR